MQVVGYQRPSSLGSVQFVGFFHAAISRDVGLRQEALLSQTDRRRTARNVSRNLVNCRTAVGTSCTTNPEEIEVMELEGYSRPACNKLCAFSHDTLDRRRVLLTTLVHHRLCRAKFSRVPEGSAFIFEGTRISL